MTQLDKDVEAKFKEFMTDVQINAFDHKNGKYDYSYIESSVKQFLAQELALAKEEGAREAIRNMPIKELPSHLRLSDGTILTPKTSAYWDLFENLTNPSVKEKS